MDAAHTRTALHAEINVTPLIDVMLVLLIIFMIAMPMLTQNLQLERSQSVVPVPVEPIRLSLDGQGQVHWQGQRLDRQQVDYLLKTSARRDPQPAVLIASADGARYQRLAELMAMAKSARIKGIALEASP